jgi:GTP cyclohydrolase I
MGSKEVRARIVEAGENYFANANISRFVCEGDLAAIETEVAGHMEAVLQALVIDTEADHNSNGTAKRVAKMFVREVFAGRFEPAPPVTDFPNAARLDEIYTVGPITVRSACSHHMVPIMGQAWVGVIPGVRVIGLSKFNRLAEWVLARPQIQEEAVVMLADEIEARVAPKALAVVVRAKHLCCGWRGVRDEGSLMTTSVMRGLFRENEAARRELLTLLRGQGFS